jgi:uncharacterized protein YndB with AHSA1/START domain
VIVQQRVRVECPPAAAFTAFTSRIDAWWPLRAGFSYGADRCQSIHLEARVGGRFFERFVDGDELQVGTVVLCEVPHRIIFTWAPPVWPGATEVEVRFTADGEHATTVQLEHRGFESLGADAQATRDGFDKGWPTVLAAYANHIGATPDSPTA